MTSKFKRGAIVFMIAVFSVAGIIACGGEQITGSQYFSVDGGDGGDGNNSGGTTIVDPPNDDGNGGSVIKDEYINEDGSWNIEQTKGESYYPNSYRGIHVPGLSPSPWVNISYNDTNRLDRLWKAMIDGWKKDGQRRLYIKTDQGDLFFDENYDIRWSRRPDVVLKYFQGGLIVNLLSGKGQSGKLPNNARDYDARGGEGWDGFYYLGGLYTFAMSRQQAAQLNCRTINQFFGWDSKAHNNEWNLYKGRMEVLVLHRNIVVNGDTGLWSTPDPWRTTGYALQVYMDDFDNGYANGNAHLLNLKGNSPERYMPTLAKDGAHNLYKCGFRWMYGKTYDPNNYQ